MMSSYYSNVLAFEQSQNTVMLACLFFSLSAVIGWFLIPRLIPAGWHKWFRPFYLGLCLFLYALMAVWFAVQVMA